MCVAHCKVALSHVQRLKQVYSDSNDSSGLRFILRKEAGLSYTEGMALQFLGAKKEIMSKSFSRAIASFTLLHESLLTEATSVDQTLAQLKEKLEEVEETVDDGYEKGMLQDVTSIGFSEESKKKAEEGKDISSCIKRKKGGEGEVKSSRSE
ncbi:hypothetical protein GEMRC1_004192 [Eukaryota sp. GEM-RC1]